MSDHSYQATTRDIHVCVTPRFLDDQSDEENNQFVWAYEVDIINEGTQTVQLRERRWEITDANGKQEIVNGPGVVGEQPILNPGDAFRYTSGCPLSTPSGFMVGSYTMVNEKGEEFLVDIPAFSLDLPDAMTTVN